MDSSFQTMSLSDCNRYVGIRVRQMRSQLHLSQQELGDRIGLARSRISMLENNEQQFTFTRLVQISRAFGCSVADLIGEQSPTPPSKAETA